MISIIIPVYNAQTYISQCLDSVLGQTMQDFEVIMIDDGSKDDSGKICDLYADKDVRIHVYHRDNQGVSNARNFGMEKASGEYIMFLDSDDYLEKDALEYMLKIMETDKADFIGFSRYEEHVEQEYIDVYSLESQNIIVNTADEYLEMLLQLYMQNKMFCEVWNRLYRLDIIRKNEIKFDTNLKYGEDKLFNLCYLHFVYKIVLVDRPLYHYRIYEESTMGNKRNKTEWLKDHYLRIAMEYGRFIKVHKSVVDSDKLISLVFSSLMHEVYYQVDKKKLYQLLHYFSVQSDDRHFFIKYSGIAYDSSDLILRYFNINQDGKEHGNCQEYEFQYNHSIILLNSLFLSYARRSS